MRFLSFLIPFDGAIDGADVSVSILYLFLLILSFTSYFLTCFANTNVAFCILYLLIFLHWFILCSIHNPNCFCLYIVCQKHFSNGLCKDLCTKYVMFIVYFSTIQ
eukprot:213584_1